MTKTGILYRTETGIAADLTDKWGYRYRLEGVPKDVGGVKAYAVTIKTTHIPDWLTMPMLDDDVGEPSK